MSNTKTLNTATLAFITLAAVALGGLIGLAIIKQRHGHHHHEHDAEPARAQVDTPAGTTLIFRQFDGAAAVATTDEDGNVLAAAVGENVVSADGDVDTRTVTVTVPADGAIEYKAILQSGAPLVFSWRADSAVYYDFHGHDETNETGFFTRYSEGVGTTDAGGIVAAYSGQHGWYWENDASEPVSVTLTVAGFFDDLVELEF